MQTQIRLKEQSDQGLYCLPFLLHNVDISMAAHGVSKLLPIHVVPKISEKNVPRHTEKVTKTLCVPTEKSDQPAHLCCLI